MTNTNTTAQHLAVMIDGLEYGTRDFHKQMAEFGKRAKALGLVIVYGASDDLMEFEGAISDEVSAYGGGSALVDAKGLIPRFHGIDRDDEPALADYFARKPHGKEIKAIWSDDEYPTWTIKTDIPHESFQLNEDGAAFCRGIVFRMASLA